VIGVRMIILSLDTGIPGFFTEIANGDRIEKSTYLPAYVQPHITGNTIVLSGTLFTWCVTNTKHQLEGSLGGTDDVTEGNIGGFLDKVIAAVGTPLASKYLGFFKLLEDLLKIPGADLLTPGNILDLGRETNRVVSDVEKSSDAVTALGGKSHFCPLLRCLNVAKDYFFTAILSSLKSASSLHLPPLPALNLPRGVQPTYHNDLSRYSQKRSRMTGQKG
jgi:hypothetical protein